MAEFGSSGLMQLYPTGELVALKSKQRIHSSGLMHAMCVVLVALLNHTNNGCFDVSPANGGGCNNGRGTMAAFMFLAL